MVCDLTKEKLVELVVKQLNNFFMDIDSKTIVDNIDRALQRTEKCLMASNNKYYYNDKNEFQFNTFHSGQYSIFLYYLANSIYISDVKSSMTDKIYYLNKIMNGVDWYYAIKLPEIFGVEHPIGSVLGRANYSDGLFIYQGVTVGGNKGHYPTIGRNVILYSNATVLGKSIIGENTLVSSGCYIKDESIPPCSIVFGQSPNLIVKQKGLEYMNSIFSFWK